MVLTPAIDYLKPGDLEQCIRDDVEIDFQMPVNLTSRSYVKLFQKDYDVIRFTPHFILHEIGHVLGIEDPRINIENLFFNVHKGNLPGKKTYNMYNLTL